MPQKQLGVMRGQEYRGHLAKNPIHHQGSPHVLKRTEREVTCYRADNLRAVMRSGPQLAASVCFYPLQYRAGVGKLFLGGRRGHESAVLSLSILQAWTSTRTGKKQDTQQNRHCHPHIPSEKGTRGVMREGGSQRWRTLSQNLQGERTPTTDGGELQQPALPASWTMPLHIRCQYCERCLRSSQKLQ